MEQRANIRFCFKTGKTATETFQLIKQAYDDSALSRTWGSLIVFEWFKRFNPSVPYAVYSTPAVCHMSTYYVHGTRLAVLSFSSYFELLFFTYSSSLGMKLKRKFRIVVSIWSLHDIFITFEFFEEVLQLTKQCALLPYKPISNLWNSYELNMLDEYYVLSWILIEWKVDSP
jgi:hypothetical protein